MTDYSSFYSRFIKKMYYAPEAAESLAVRRAAERLPHIPLYQVQDKEHIPPADRVTTTVFFTAGRGRTVNFCPGSRGHLCCNYLTIDLYMGCPIGCSYCIMRSYLNFPPLTVNVDTEGIVRDIERLVSCNPGRRIRLGTGETGDSLFFDPLFELSRELVTRCAAFPTVALELKTKTDFVDHILDLEAKGGAVIAFSVNPQTIIDAEEGLASGLEERLAAAERACAAGYRLAFHFDPIIRIQGWEDAYGAVARRLAAFPRERIAWISLGTMRYSKELFERFVERPYLYDEFVPSRDGKFRYLQPVREAMYRFLASSLEETVGAPVYLCMESPAVWRRVFGKLPSHIPSLRDIMRGVVLP